MGSFPKRENASLVVPTMSLDSLVFAMSLDSMTAHGDAGDEWISKASGGLLVHLDGPAVLHKTDDLTDKVAIAICAHCTLRCLVCDV